MELLPDQPVEATSRVVAKVSPKVHQLQDINILITKAVTMCMAHHAVLLAAQDIWGAHVQPTIAAATRHRERWGLLIGCLMI